MDVLIKAPVYIVDGQLRIVVDLARDAKIWRASDPFSHTTSHHPVSQDRGKCSAKVGSAGGGAGEDTMEKAVRWAVYSVDVRQPRHDRRREGDLKDQWEGQEKAVGGSRQCSGRVKGKEVGGPRECSGMVKVRVVRGSRQDSGKVKEKGRQWEGQGKAVGGSRECSGMVKERQWKYQGEAVKGSRERWWKGQGKAVRGQ